MKRIAFLTLNRFYNIEPDKGKLNKSLSFLFLIQFLLGTTITSTHPGHHKSSYGTVCNNGVNVRYELVTTLSVKTIALQAVTPVVW
jgi:hypothetical protein